MTRIQLTTSRISYHFCLPLTEFPARLFINHHRFCLSLCTFCNLNGGTKQNILGTLYMVSCPPTGSDFCRQRQDCRCTISSIQYSSAVQFSPLLISGNNLTFQFRSHNVISLIPFTFLSYYAEYEKYICA